MKIQQKDIDYIKNTFAQLKSKEDLLQLLNYSKQLIFGENTVPFQLRQLTYYSNPNVNTKRYTEFEISKKSGGKRIIHAPVKGLLIIQKCLNLIFQIIFEPHAAAMGFTSGKSVVSNAIIHTNSLYVFNIDLKDFFHTVDQARVWKCLQNKPFNLVKSPVTKIKIDYRLKELLNQRFESQVVGNKYEVVNIISALCCTELLVERKTEEGRSEIVLKRVLPQGAPTSPTLTNVVCQRLDYLLSGVAKRFGLRYSRYADDITFSSMHNVYQSNSGFINELYRIVEDQGFQIKESKTRLQKDGYRQEVTGLTVNKKVNVAKGYVKQLRMWLYYWKSYGYEKANDIFLLDYIKDKPSETQAPSLSRVLAGKLCYLKMVKGSDDSCYQKLREQYLNLVQSQATAITDSNYLIEILLDEGVDKAMTIYKPTVK